MIVMASLFAQSAAAQEILDKPVTVAVRNVELSKLILQIEKQTGVPFVYSSKAIDARRKVSVEVMSQKLGIFLNGFFRSLNISFDVLNNQVVLFRSGSTVAAASDTLLRAGLNAPPERALTGTITSGKGQPLTGASIVIKDGVQGTTSDEQGQFRLNLPAGRVSLVISAVGYETIERTIEQETALNLSLNLADRLLDDVVVIGYGTSKKRDITGAISSICSDEISNQPVAGFDQAITGKAAGVRVSAGNAAPGGGQSVLIRGIGSINASAAPLYVIDGMPMPESYDKNENPLNAVNPSDIESIEILKDASSSAIYGARASNGVIIITTKRGKKGKPSLSFGNVQGILGMERSIDMLNAADYKQYLRDSKSQAYVIQDPFLWDDKRRSYTWDTPDAERLANLYSRNNEGIASEKRIERWFVLSDTIKNDPDDIDWIDEITRTGCIQDYQISATGGSDNATYMISANYFDQQGIVKSSGYKRYGARANVDLRLSDKLKFGINLAPSYEIFDKLDKMEGNDGPNGLFGMALVMPPIYAPFDKDGSPAYLGTIPNGPYDYDIAALVNPYRLFEIKTIGYNMRAISAMYGEARLSKDLVFRSELNTEIRNRIGEYFSPATVPTTTTRESRSVGSSERQNRIYLNTQNILTYTNHFGEHAVTALAGYQAEKTTYRNDFIRKYDFFGNELSSLNNSSSIDNPLTDARTSEAVSTMVGTFGRLLYNYRSKYYLTASIRRDGSSKFGKDNRWGNFPSFAVAWRPIEEKFLSKAGNLLSDWKIRGGWGKVGNSSIADYQALNRLGNADYSFGGSSSQLAIGTYDLGIAYTNLGWESTEDLNVGTDIALFAGRIRFTYDYFVRKTRDMLYNVALVAQTGFSSQTRNISAMENRGMEFTLNTVNINGALAWKTNVNISFVRNKVLDLGPQNKPLTGIDTRTEVGKPISNIFGYYYLGPYRDWQEVKTNPIVMGGNVITRSVPGDARYADINMDGVIDANDQTVIGNPQPDFVFGLNNAFTFKNFDLNIQVSGVQGGDINIRAFRRDVFGGNSGRNNIPQFYFDNYWRPDRPDARYEAPNRKSYTKQFLTSSQTVEKGSFVNISNINVGYRFPASLLSRFEVNALRIYLSVQNAWMFTRYHGFNPESNVAGIDARTQGTDELGYPIARTTALGVNLNF